MKRIDSLIKKYLTEKRAATKVERTSNCPSEAKLSEYLCALLAKEENKAMSAHIAGCLWCVEQLDIAQRAERSVVVKERLDRLFAESKKNRWLIGSLMAFGLSFFLPEFFLQFLVLAAILGTKWVFDTATNRTLIMVYDAWRKRHKGEPEDEDILKKLEDRLKKKHTF